MEKFNMATKPSPDTIINTYSLDELLELVKVKSEQNTNDQIQEFRNQINQFTFNTSSPSEAHASKPTTESNTPKQNHRPRRRTTSSKRNNKPSGKSLSSMIITILQNSSVPMKIDDLYNALKKKKWTTKSDNPKRIIQMELHKLLQKQQIKRADRGMYEFS
jgi:hypothetical protein